MYYQGIDHPDREPSRNRFCDPKRKSKFTEEVAKDVQNGDLYFMGRSTAAMRYFVPVEQGEHGTAEDEEGVLLCVTHQFNKRWPDLPGKWEPYDGGGNLVIKVPRAADSDIPYEALSAIESALYYTPLGRAVGHDAMRPLALSLLKTFGIERDDIRSTFTVDPKSEKQAKDALRDLLTYAPSTGYHDKIGKLGAKVDNVGFAKDEDEYVALVDGDSDGFGGEGRGKALPLMSQPVFYAVLGGKHEARGFQARIDALMEAVGLTEEDMR
jgi:hypothetical protein